MMCLMDPGVRVLREWLPAYLIIFQFLPCNWPQVLRF